jgi:hypothetical protein
VIKWLATVLFVACPCLLGAAQSSQQVVEEFCRLDLSGARLHSTEDAPIWHLTLNDGEPPAGPVVIARGFHAAKAVEQGESGTVTVRYDVLGVVGADEVFKPGSEQFALGRFQLKEQDGWKISLQSLAVSPHVSPEAYSKHIDLLTQAINRQPLEKRDEPRRIALEKLKAQVLALR